MRVFVEVGEKTPLLNRLAEGDANAKGEKDVCQITAVMNLAKDDYDSSSDTVNTGLTCAMT